MDKAEELAVKELDANADFRQYLNISFIADIIEDDLNYAAEVLGHKVELMVIYIWADSYFNKDRLPDRIAVVLRGPVAEPEEGDTEPRCYATNVLPMGKGPKVLKVVTAYCHKREIPYRLIIKLEDPEELY